MKSKSEIEKRLNDLRENLRQHNNCSNSEIASGRIGISEDVVHTTMMQIRMLEWVLGKN